MNISNDDKKLILKLCKDLYKIYLAKMENGELDITTISEIISAQKRDTA
jgi:hypothetical protein